PKKSSSFFLCASAPLREDFSSPSTLSCIMLRVGLAGIGFMGWIHYLSYKKTKGVKLSAICTRDERKLGGDWRGDKGNVGPPGEKVDVSDMTKYTSLDRLLDDPSIDLVDI